jgi:DNA-binding CsgD family transcriptional regulator
MLTALFDAVPLGFGVLDQEFRYRAVNQALATMNRVAPQAHLGKTIRDVIGDPAATLEAPFRHVVCSGHHVSVEFWAKLLNRREASLWVVDYFPVECAKGRVKLVGAVVAESACQNEGQHLFRGVLEKLVQNPVLTPRASDALLRQIMSGSFRQVPDFRATPERSEAVDASSQIPFFPRNAMQEARENCFTRAVALTPREQEVVKLLAQGTGNKETAAILGITVKTVESHRARIMFKLGLHSTRELVHYAIRNKMLNLAD